MKQVFFPINEILKRKLCLKSQKIGGGDNACNFDNPKKLENFTGSPSV